MAYMHSHYELRPIAIHADVRLAYEQTGYEAPLEVVQVIHLVDRSMAPGTAAQMVGSLRSLACAP